MPHYIVTLLTDEREDSSTLGVTSLWAANVEDAVTQALAKTASRLPAFVERCERAHVVAVDGTSIVRDIPYSQRLMFLPDGA